MNIIYWRFWNNRRNKI